jgi:hypothetical protein
MNTDKPPLDVDAQAGPRYPLLERITAVVLALVLVAVVCMTLSAWRPEWDWGLSLDAQVGVVVALLTAALVLVSVVALLHTRR